MYLVTERGFIDSPPIDYLTLDELPAMDIANDAGVGPAPLSLLMEADADVAAVGPSLRRLQRVCIPFDSAADGRGFSLARQLRSLGYGGVIRARGNVICDQYRYLLECGFDEIEISAETARRQPVEHWRDHGQPGYRQKLASAVRRPPAALADGEHAIEVIDVEHYSDDVFRFTTTRPDALRFVSGEFAMLGMAGAASPLFRAYSITSASWDEHLEFYSIKRPDGEFTRRLQWIRGGDPLLLKKKTTGSLTLTSVLPGRRLFLIATGTGIAPFASLIREPECYERFERIIVTHTCRGHDELAFGHDAVARAREDPLVGEQARDRLVSFSSTTRERGTHTGRITNLIDDGTLYSALGIEPLDPRDDRIMICGSAAVLRDTRALCERLGFEAGCVNRAGGHVWERSFAG